MLTLRIFIRRHRNLRSLLALGVAIIMGVVIFLCLTNQREKIKERMTAYGQDIKSLAYAGIKHPMSGGDSASIKKQLIDIEDELKNAEIFIFDFNQRIVFATHDVNIGQNVSDITHYQETLTALKLFLTESGAPLSYIEEEKDGKKYLITIHAILNDNECHHCHGSTRQVLGGLLVRQSTDATYAAIATLRNQTIIISIIGVGALLFLIYFLVARMVHKPITELVAKAELLTRGDYSVSVPVTSEDPIGVLGSSFNSMVQSIKAQIEYANSLKHVIADPLIFVDNDLVISFINEACTQLLGYSKEETEGILTCRDIFKSDICKNKICDTTCPIKQCLVSGEPVQGIRTTILDIRGRSIPIMTSANALKDAHGSIIGAVETFRDISVVLEGERLHFVQQTAENEEEQRKYLESKAANLLAVLSQVSDGNLSVRVAYSDSNEVMGKIGEHINDTLNNFEKMYEQISSFGKKMELEVARRTTMLRSRTLLLERANRELQELDRLKSSFLANMSHELRTPMNSILGYTELLLDLVDGEINSEQESSLLKVENNAKHLMQLINDILDMSKIESGKIEFDIQKSDIKKLCESFTTFFHPALQAKDLFLKFDFADDLPPVYIDEEKVRQIFNNLIANAIKFTEQGGITIHAKKSTLGIAAGDKPLFVEICVEDTGIGIENENMRTLFDKFSQINVSTTRQYEGTGLGLSIARGLVVLHKGVIWADSTYGEGSKFCFTLPSQKEVIENTEELIIELSMADTLADYFDKPVETFLKEPNYAGKPVKCWEYTHCGQTSCPAYGHEERRCWLICGVHCKGVKVAKYPEKVEYCKACEIIENLVIDEYQSCEQTDKRNSPCNPKKKKTILAIDDNPEVIELIRKNIGTDYNVVGHLTGKNAFEKAKEINPEVITLDIMMPEKDGWQVLQELKKSPETQDIPVIILSIIDNKKMGFSLGATEYMVKPINKKTLLHKLKNLEKTTNIKNILLVDSDKDTVNTLAVLLNKAGYKITKSYNNTEAIQAIHRSIPDLIVLNPTMVNENPFDIIEYFKNEEHIQNIPLVLITDKDLDEDDLQELNGKIQATLNKSVLSEKDLVEELKKVIIRM